jgi:hypothetical protein
MISRVLAYPLEFALFNLGMRHVIRFVLLPLFSFGKSPQYTLVRGQVRSSFNLDALGEQKIT